MPVTYSKFDPRMPLKDVYAKLDLVAIECFHPYRYGERINSSRRVDAERAVVAHMKRRFSDTYIPTTRNVLSLSAGKVRYNGDSDMPPTDLIFDSSNMSKGGLLVDRDSIFAFRLLHNDENLKVAYAVRFRISSLNLFVGE